MKAQLSAHQMQPEPALDVGAGIVSDVEQGANIHRYAGRTVPRQPSYNPTEPCTVLLLQGKVKLQCW